MTMMLTTYLASLSAGIAPFPAGRMRTGAHLDSWHLESTLLTNYWILPI